VGVNDYQWEYKIYIIHTGMNSLEKREVVSTALMPFLSLSGVGNIWFQSRW